MKRMMQIALVSLICLISASPAMAAGNDTNSTYNRSETVTGTSTGTGAGMNGYRMDVNSTYGNNGTVNNNGYRTNNRVNNNNGTFRGYADNVNDGTNWGWLGLLGLLGLAGMFNRNKHKA